MKNLKKQTETKADLKELALEKLRETNGGTQAITGNPIIDIFLGFIIRKRT